MAQLRTKGPLLVLILSLGLASCGSSQPTATLARLAVTPTSATPRAAVIPTTSVSTPASPVPTASQRSPAAAILMGTPVPVASSPTATRAGITNTVKAAVTPLPDAGTVITAVAFADTAHGWLATGGFPTGTGAAKPIAPIPPAIFATSDGGRTWTQQFAPTGQVTALDAVSPEVAWAVAGGKLLQFSDGVWRAVAPPDLPRGERAIEWVDFVDAAHGWAGARVFAPEDEAHGVFRTVDGGAHWTPLAAPCALGGSTRYSFVAPATAWAICQYGGAGGSSLTALFTTADGGQTWTQLGETTRQPSGITDIFFLNSTAGWLCTQYGVSATTDGGRTWRPVPILPRSLDGQSGRETIAHIWFVTQSHGYAVSSGPRSTLLATTDGGATWSPRYALQGAWPAGFFQPLAGDSGVAVGTLLNSQAVLRTADGGQTWRPVGTVGGPAEVVQQLNFADSQHGWAVTRAAEQPSVRFYRTRDGGASWTQRGSLPPAAQAGVSSISFVDEHTGYVNAAVSQLFVTHDGGDTFQRVPSPLPGDGRIDFVSAAVGWRLVDGALFATADGGQTWAALPQHYQIAWNYPPVTKGVTRQPIAPAYTVTGFDLVASGLAWIAVNVCDPLRCEHLLLRTADGGQTWTRYELDGYYGAVPLFADAAHGWLWAQERFLYTGDGGHTWTQLR